MYSTIVISILIAIAVANCARSLRFAYKSARDLNDGGYPIFGDVFQNFFLLMLASFFTERSVVYAPYRVPVALLTFALPLVHGILIAPCKSAGHRARETRRIDLANDGQA